jgi:hypothetical protein
MFGKDQSLDNNAESGPEAEIARLQALELSQLAVEVMVGGFGPTLTAGWSGQAGVSSVDKILEILVPGSGELGASPAADAYALIGEGV